jgi:hypothetical protein
MKPSDAQPEAHVLEVLRQEGPLQGYRRLMAENDAMIRTPVLDNGRAIAQARTAAYLVIIAEWARRQQQVLGYDRPFAVVATGGTGRGEVTPCSDRDVMLLFEGRVQGEIQHDAFFKELKRQTSHTGEFEKEHGFKLDLTPCGLDDAPEVSGKELSACLDMAPVYDPGDLEPRFRERLRDSCDVFEHFLHIRANWRDQWAVAGGEAERMDRFDIKNDGLRVFLGGAWILALECFRHNRDVREEIAAEDPGVLVAYDFLLRVRCWQHLRHTPGGQGDHLGNHKEDVMRFEDFLTLGDMLGVDANERARFEFANDVRARILSARRRLSAFSQGVIERELRVGRRTAPGSAVVFGQGGLSHDPLPPDSSPQMRSDAAMSLLLEAQHYELPVDPAEMHGTFRGAREWLTLVPSFARLFTEERGSLAATFEFLSRVDGAMERLFPGYSAFESSLDERVMEGRKWTRGVMEREKMQDLESLLKEGAAKVRLGGQMASEGRLDPGLEAVRLESAHIAAVKLALKTKRLPVTPADIAARENPDLPWYERFASGLSGVPMEDYFSGWEDSHGFSATTLEVTRFLIAHRRAFKERARLGSNPPEVVDEFVKLCGTPEKLRALFVFTHADRMRWEPPGEDPVRWFNSLELYDKCLRAFRQDADPAHRILGTQGHEADDLEILRDFGPDFFGGIYGRHAVKFSSHLLRLSGGAPSVRPKAELIQEGPSDILAVAARDWRGLAACISGELWQLGIPLRQAHLFSASQHGLALDFFHVQLDGTRLPRELTAAVEAAVIERRHLDDREESSLTPLSGTLTLTQTRPGEYRLRFESLHDVPGQVYALCWRAWRHLEANIHGLISHGTRAGSYIALDLTLPSHLSTTQARQRIAAWGCSPNPDFGQSLPDHSAGV